MKVELKNIHRVRAVLPEAGAITYHSIRGARGSRFWRSGDGPVGSFEYVSAYVDAQRAAADRGDPFTASLDQPVDEGTQAGRILRARQMDQYLGEMLRACRKRARRFGVPFDLDQKWVTQQFDAQHGKCAVSGLKFRYERRGPYLPSIDRVEPKAGYVSENVRLVCFAVNTGRNAFGDAEYLRVCRAVAKNNP